MKIWALIVNILLWPGRKATSLLPDMGEDETSLVHNVVNYVVWLALFCGLLIWTVIQHPPI